MCPSDAVPTSLLVPSSLGQRPGRPDKREDMEVKVAMQGGFKVTCGDLFPFGLGVVGAVSPSDDFEASTKERRVQARDKESGLPLWQVDVMDFDPEARERTFRVKIAAAVQPVPPSAVEGVPVRPVVLEGL